MESIQSKKSFIQMEQYKDKIKQKKIHNEKVDRKYGYLKANSNIVPILYKAFKNKIVYFDEYSSQIRVCSHLGLITFKNQNLHERKVQLYLQPFGKKFVNQFDKCKKYPLIAFLNVFSFGLFIIFSFSLENLFLRILTKYNNTWAVIIGLLDVFIIFSLLIFLLRSFIYIIHYYLWFNKNDEYDSINNRNIMKFFKDNTNISKYNCCKNILKKFYNYLVFFN